jgi:hypothetical protein
VDLLDPQEFAAKVDLLDSRDPPDLPESVATLDPPVKVVLVDLLESWDQMDSKEITEYSVPPVKRVAQEPQESQVLPEQWVIQEIQDALD